MANLTKELESNQSNNDLNLKLIAENYQNKINEMKKQNEIEISTLKEEIFNTQNDKDELNIIIKMSFKYFKKINY